MQTLQVWYMRPDAFRDGIMGVQWLKERGQLPSFDTLEKTHASLGERGQHQVADDILVETNQLERVFMRQQGEMWSPNGEARDLIRSLGLEHTSMSVGDIIVKDGPADGPKPFCRRMWIVDRFGFEEIA